MRIMKRWLLSVIMIVICLSLLMLTGCAGNSTDFKADDEGAELFFNGEGWEYFEDFNPIDSSYYELSEHYSLHEDSNADGGVALRVEEKDLYFGFPALSQDEIDDYSPCTAVYGTLKTVFGIDIGCSVDDVEKLLNITFSEDYEGSLIGTALTSSGSYYVQVYTSSLSDELSSDTGVAVFRNNDENREGADSVPSEQVWVELHEVDSSAIHSMGYDPENEILAIVFRDSQELWYYYGVPESVYEEMENAESIGSYYNNYIKGVYASAEQH